MKNHIKPTKEEIINRAFQFHSKGNILEAANIIKFLLIEDLKIIGSFQIME